MPRLMIRVDFESDLAFGPGKARLLELIEDTGSLRRAAAAMDMSYRRAWLLLRETQTMVKAPIVAAQTGGAGGGGTVLTPFARKLVECYRAIETHATHAAAAELRAMAAMSKRGSTPSAAKVSRKRKGTRNTPRTAS